MDFNFKEQAATKTKEELIEIYTNPTDYQEAFVNAAVEELQNRIIGIDEYKKVKDLKAEKLEATLQNGVPGDPLYITMGFISACFGGIIGIVAGYVYRFSKRQGNYYYDIKTRKKGALMMLLGVFVLLAFVAWQLDNN